MKKFIKVILTLTTVLMFSACGPNDGLTDHERSLLTKNQIKKLLEYNNGEKLDVFISRKTIDYWVLQWRVSSLNKKDYQNYDFNNFVGEEMADTKIIIVDSYKSPFNKYLAYGDEVIDVTGIGDSTYVYKIPYPEFQLKFQEFLKTNPSKRTLTETEARDIIIEQMLDLFDVDE